MCEGKGREKKESRHDMEVKSILKCLWAIRDKDEFYFMAYGKDMIEQYVEQRVHKAHDGLVHPITDNGTISTISETDK